MPTMLRNLLFLVCLATSRANEYETTAQVWLPPPSLPYNPVSPTLADHDSTTEMNVDGGLAHHPPSPPPDGRVVPHIVSHNAYKSFLHEIHTWLCRVLDMEICDDLRISKAHKVEFCDSLNAMSKDAAIRCAARQYSMNHSDETSSDAIPSSDGENNNVSTPSISIK